MRGLFEEPRSQVVVAQLLVARSFTMSRRFHLRWLVIGATASALWLSGCEAPNRGGDESAPDVVVGDSVDEPASGDLAVELSGGKLTVTAAEAVSVTITLTNTAQHPVRLLSWYAPADELEEDLFLVMRDGQSVEFTGPHYKRPAPEESDYITLDPGETLTRTVDLTRFYDFSQTGDYTIRYSVDYKAPEVKEPIAIDSNDAKLWIEARLTPLPQQVGAGGTNGLAFSKCTASQSDTVAQALAAAQSMASGAASYLTSTTPSGTPRYTTWFGAFSSSGWTTATNHFNAIQDAVYNKPMTFDCGCKKKYYAYVYPNQPYTVYLCSVFWSAPMSGTDSKGGTIIHETSHFSVVASTDDWVYGQSGAQSLALSDPSKALDNADTHEYFAENTPAQQ